MQYAKGEEAELQTCPMKGRAVLTKSKPDDGITSD